jgi:hypothetical protein
MVISLYPEGIIGIRVLRSRQEFKFEAGRMFVDAVKQEVNQKLQTLRTKKKKNKKINGRRSK